MHSNILNFINTISISGDSEYANTIEIKREIKEYNAGFDENESDPNARKN